MSDSKRARQILVPVCFTVTSILFLFLQYQQTFGSLGTSARRPDPFFRGHTSISSRGLFCLTTEDTCHFVRQRPLVIHYIMSFWNLKKSTGVRKSAWVKSFANACSVPLGRKKAETEFLRKGGLQLLTQAFYSPLYTDTQKQHVASSPKIS